MIAGSAIAKTAVAAERPGYVLKVVTNWPMPTETGYNCSLPNRYTSGSKYWFHTKKKWKIVTAVIAGMAWGIMIEMRIRSGPAPSIMAASSNSLGMLMKYCRSKKTSYALAKKAGTNSGSQV